MSTLSVHHPDAEHWQQWARGRRAPLLQQAPWAAHKARFGWQVERLIVGHEQARSGAQLLLRTRYGVGVGYIPHGPLWSGDPAVDRELLRQLRRLAWRRRLLFVRLEPDIADDEPHAAALEALLRNHGAVPAASLQPRTTFVLDLAPEPDALLRACSKGHRADIKRAERDGVQIRLGTTDDIATFTRLMTVTGARKDFAAHTAAYYTSALQLHGEHARLLIAELNGVPVAGHFYLSDGTTVNYLYSGATDDGRRAGANHLLSWTAIQWARSSGARFLDFCGVPDAYGAAAAVSDPAEQQRWLTAAELDPLNGVYRFKKGFGGRLVRRMSAYDLVLVPSLLYRFALRGMRS